MLITPWSCHLHSSFDSVILLYDCYCIAIVGAASHPDYQINQGKICLNVVTYAMELNKPITKNKYSTE